MYDFASSGSRNVSHILCHAFVVCTLVVTRSADVSEQLKARKGVLGPSDEGMKAYDVTST